MSQQARICFIGLGVMGYPMAGHLARAGYPVTVYNRNAEKARRWMSEYGGLVAATPADAARRADILLLCVGGDDDVREVLFGEQGAVHGLMAGATVIDHTTTSATLARELSKALGDEGVDFVDAPVSGGQAGAEKGQLTIMCGGEAATCAEIAPVLQTYSRRVRYMGKVGNGQLTKMVNQICIAGLIEGLAEGIHFARGAGLDVDAVIDVISKGAAQSWQMDNRANTMIKGQYDHGFAVDWMRKDLAYVLDEARNNGSSLPVTALVDELYSDVQAIGGGRWDTSSLLARLEKTKQE